MAARRNEIGPSRLPPRRPHQTDNAKFSRKPSFRTTLSAFASSGRGLTPRKECGPPFPEEIPRPVAVAEGEGCAFFRGSSGMKSTHHAHSAPGRARGPDRCAKGRMRSRAPSTCLLLLNPKRASRRRDPPGISRLADATPRPQPPCALAQTSYHPPLAAGPHSVANHLFPAQRNLLIPAPGKARKPNQERTNRNPWRKETEGERSKIIGDNRLLSDPMLSAPRGETVSHGAGACASRRPSANHGRIFDVPDKRVQGSKFRTGASAAQ